MLISEKNPLDLRNYVWVVYIKQRFDSQTHMLQCKKDNGTKNCKDYGKKIRKGLIDLVDFPYLV